MPNTHTPGPWLYRPEEYDDWGMVRAAPDAEGRMFVICQARNPSVGYDELDKYRESRTDPYEANARLIAAAPELLEALKHVTNCLVEEMGNLANEDETDDEDLAAILGVKYARHVIAIRLRIRQARAAITKAEG